MKALVTIELIAIAFSFWVGWRIRGHVDRRVFYAVEQYRVTGNVAHGPIVWTQK